ncbi:glycosyltransferase [Naasia aerilata]|uniref:Glycosyl transferase n=1 Tax=Naasia aerilata TaxID=1162966 RepID=A0ABN6XTK1_9MICO|nr:glycosyltransferase [Naasia aerilata]BDZ46965.1 glycosyl transferase [Naasia aerilata]
MSRVLVAVMPFTGHVAPFRAVVRELVSRGHDVRVYTGEAFRAGFEALGARVLPWTEAPDFDENDLSATFPALRGRPGPRQLLANLEQLFLRTGVGQHRDLVAAWRSEPWDVLLGDALSTGASLVAETTGCRWASLSVVPLSIPSRDLPPAGLRLRPHHTAVGGARDAALRFLVNVAGAPLQRAYQQVRAGVQLPPTDRPFYLAWLSPQLLLALGSPALDYGRSDPPPNLVYVGAIPATSDAPLPDWWGQVASSTRPVVYVTQGTQNVDPTHLLEPALAALSARNVLVVASTGIRGRTRLPFSVPAGTRVADFVPQDRLMPFTSVMITNGGWGGVLGALSAGVPLVVAGGDLDKPDIAARVAYARAGIDLRTGRPNAAQVLAAYDRLTAEPAFRATARRLGTELRDLGGAPRIADEVERLAAA